MPRTLAAIDFLDAAIADLGPDFFDRRDTAATARRLVKRLEQLGNQATLEKVA